MKNKNVKYYNENGELEPAVHNLVGEHLIKPMAAKEKRKKDKILGVKMVSFTIFFVVMGILLIVLAIENKNFSVIKIIGSIICFCVSFIFGVVAHALLVPPKYVNYVGRFDK